MATGIIHKTDVSGGAGYSKLPDGTLICWGSKSYDLSNKVSQSSSAYKYWYVECVEDINFPVPFYTTPSLTVTKTGGNGTTNVGWVGFNATKITEIDFVFPAEPVLTSAAPTICWQAIGRWKA